MSSTILAPAANMASHDLPERLPLSIDHYAKLDAQQAGHLRHFHNLVAQPDGMWKLMGCQDPAQEAFDAYRFQISSMAFAASLAHYHRLPALRGVFKPLLHRLIHKMLRRDVWGYWYNTSMGSTALDPSLKKLREPSTDPVVRENIMYSGHLLMMVCLYTMLFDDDEFEQPDSMVFQWDPKWWGAGRHSWKYSIPTLKQTILTDMENNHWVGCCCEPNTVFIVCNQFHLIALRFNDARHGTKELEEVLPKFVDAWEKKGMIQDDGLIVAFWAPNQDRIEKSPDVTLTAWAAIFLAAWDSDNVKKHFERQSEGYITNIDGQVRVRPATVARRIRQLIATDPATHSASSAETIAAAKEYAKQNSTAEAKEEDRNPTFGYAVQWVGEVGRQDLLDGLLEYADQNFNPTWEDGGLFYPRQDEQGVDWTFIDPYTGNTAIAYARLNVPDGQKQMFENPWTKEQLARRPYVDHVDLSQGVDFLRGTWDEEQNALIVTLRSWDEKVHVIEPRANNLGGGDWAIYVNHELQRIFSCSDGSAVSHKVEVPATGELDLVLLRRAKA